MRILRRAVEARKKFQIVIDLGGTTTKNAMHTPTYWLEFSRHNLKVNDVIAFISRFTDNFFIGRIEGFVDSTGPKGKSELTVRPLSRLMGIPGQQLDKNTLYLITFPEIKCLLRRC